MAFERWKERANALEEQVYVLYLSYRDPRTPTLAKVVIVLTVAYAVSPVDPIPDFVPVLGYLDELLVLPVGAALALRLVPDEAVDDCRERTPEEIDAGYVRWVVAGVVLVAWFVLGALAVRTLAGWP